MHNIQLWITFKNSYATEGVSVRKTRGSPILTSAQPNMCVCACDISELPWIGVTRNSNGFESIRDTSNIWLKGSTYKEGELRVYAGDFDPDMEGAAEIADAEIADAEKGEETDFFPHIRWLNERVRVREVLRYFPNKEASAWKNILSDASFPKMGDEYQIWISPLWWPDQISPPLWSNSAKQFTFLDVTSRSDAKIGENLSGLLSKFRAAEN